MVLLERALGIEHTPHGVVGGGGGALGLPLAYLAQVLVGLGVEHARGGEDLLSILQRHVKELPLLLELGRLQLYEIGGVVGARQQLVRHAHYVLNARRATLYLIVVQTHVLLLQLLV